MTIHFDQDLDDIYLIRYLVNIQNLVIQVEEVQNVKWASLEDITNLLKQEKFVLYHQNLISLYFEMKNKHGAQRL